MAILDQIFRLGYRSSVASPGSAPVIVLRQEIITQTITRPYTTVIALVTLGPADPTSTSPLATSTTTVANTGSTTNPVTTAADTSTSSLTPTQLGAILGSVLGAALLLLLWTCYYVSVRRRNHAERMMALAMDDRESEMSFESVSEMRPAGPAWWRAGTVPANSWARPAAAQHPPVVPPPPTFPPTPRFNPSGHFRHTRYPQMNGVKRYP